MSYPSSAGFAYDLGTLLRELAVEAKLDHEAARESETEDLQLGRLMALHDVLALVQSQAEAFGLAPTDVGLGGFDAYRDLL